MLIIVESNLVMSAKTGIELEMHSSIEQEQAKIQGFFTNYDLWRLIAYHLARNKGKLMTK